ncbi:RNA polymerase sigma factor [Anaerostipes sp.]
MILFFFQEISQKEIARMMGIKLSLVKYRVSRAKKLLEKYLGEGE